eukprot:289297_1
MSTSWNILPQCSNFYACFSDFAAYSHHNVIIVVMSRTPNYFITPSSKTCIYNIDQNKWTNDREMHWNLPMDITDEFAATVDKNNDILYIVNYKTGISSLYKIDLQNHKYEQFFLIQDTLNGLRFDVTCVSVMIKNQLNMFVFCPTNTKHFIWNEKQKIFIKQSNETDLIVSNQSEIVYLSSQQNILIVGGAKRNNPMFETDDSIYSYYIENKQWNKLNVKLPIPLRHFGCVITQNERYVIIFGGITNLSKKVDDIYMLNTNTMCFSKSKLKCVMKGHCKAVIPDYYTLKDKICVFGYIRTTWKAKQFNDVQYLPHYLIELMKKFYINDCIHLIHQGGHHNKIKVDAIFA